MKNKKTTAGRCRRYHKRAISGMIAVFVLVVITLVIGVIFVGMSKNYIIKGKQDMTLSKTDMRCGTDVGISVPDVADRYKICKSSGTDTEYLNVTILNTGTLTIDDMSIKIYQENGFTENQSTLNSSLTPGGMVEIGVPYSNLTGGIRQVNIVPRIDKPGQTEPIFCEGSQLTFSDISRCT